MIKKNGGPAFPKVAENFKVGWAGMSLRDWFAGRVDIPWAIAEQVAAIWNGHEPDIQETIEVRAKLRLIEADAMLKERGQGEEAPAP